MKINYRYSLSVLLISSVLMIATAGCDKSNSQDKVLETALEMVKNTNLGENLIGMCGRKLNHSEAYKNMANASSPESAHTVLDKALKKVLPKFQNQWNKNLAEAYIYLLSVEEMASKYHRIALLL